MNKDVIYIDVDDDITAIIGKVKSSKDKIIALVPPKRIGVLQSAVNLRLLDRTATLAKKHLVIITNNPALAALSASANIPVAKNLQSKPELAEIAALSVDGGEDIIDGAQLPIGEHAKTVDQPADIDSAADKAAASVIAAEKKSAVVSSPVKKGSASKSGRVPNFNMFRKKFIVIISAVALLAAFLIWAIFFAPRATVVITAKTSTESLSKAVALSETKETSFDAGVVRMIRQEEKKAESVDFEATGEENKGEKATGVVRFSTGTFAGLGTIPAGTQLTSSSGLVYVTDSSVTLVAPGVGGTVSSATVSVTAAENGAEYNAANGNLRGAPSGVSAIFTDATSGGTDKLVKVVTAADVQKASQELSEKEDSGAKNRLTSAFGDRVRVIESSFTTKKSAAKSSPAVGQEASGSARLSTEITYSVVGIAESELKAYFEAAAADLIADQPSQRIYDDGAKNAKVGEPETEGDAIRAQLSTEVKIGPEIKDDEVKEKVKGKRFGDIQADISIIQGVSDVDVKFWPFWVRTVPNNTDRITIEFKVDE